MTKIEPDAYELLGVTENKDENGDYYESRESVLSYEEDDAGNIDMRISEANPLFKGETIIYFIKTHKEKFAEFWQLHDDEKKLLDDFVAQFCRYVEAEFSKEKLKEVIEDMAGDEDKGNKNGDSGE